MNSISTKLCRLCLESSDEMLNIFDCFQNSTISAILIKHFWFQIDKNDGMPEWLCEICWIQTKTFHHFYRRVEIRHGNYDKIPSLIKKERTASPSVGETDSNFHIDLDIVKQEEIGPPAQMAEVLVTKEENRFSDERLDGYNDDNSFGESENSLTSDDDDTPINKKSKNHHTKDKTASSSSLNAETPDSNSQDRLKIAQQDAQIREFFTMKCDICTDNIEFENFRQARGHYRIVHNKRGYLRCCGNKFHHRCKVLDHIRFHMNPDAYRCDECDKSFKDSQALKTHTDNHVPQVRAYQCDLCSNTFIRAASLKVHVQNVHRSSSAGEMFPCEKCSKPFRSRTSLASHIRCVHEFSLDHVCEICARRFKTKQLLKGHIFATHSTEPKVQCDKCGTWLKHKLCLRIHLKRCQQTNCEPVTCTICNKEVPSSHALTRHTNRVHGTKSHQCKYCDKTFKTPKSLKEHIAIHTGEYLYDCLYCDKKFKSNANMYSHRKKMHVEEWTRDREHSTSTAQNQSSQNQLLKEKTTIESL